MLERIKHFLAPPIFPDDEEKTHFASSLNVILITIFLVIIFLVGAISLMQTIQPQIRITGLIMALVTLVIWGIMRQGHVKAAATLLAALILIGGIFILYQNGSMRDSFKPALLVTIIIASLFVGDVASYIFAGLSVLSYRDFVPDGKCGLAAAL